jgi:hypothetical protein
MHSILSLLSGAVLVVLVYGLSFFPSATLAQIEEVEEAMSRADQEAIFCLSPLIYLSADRPVSARSAFSHAGRTRGYASLSYSWRIP